MEAAILAQPADKVLVADYFDALTPGLGKEGANERIAALQDRTASLLPGVLLHLELTLKNDGVRGRFEGLFEKTASDPLIKACDAIWRAHVRKGPIDRDACKLVNRERSRIASTYFNFMAKPLTQIALFRHNARHAETLAEAGVLVEELKAALGQFISFGSPQWEAVVTGARHANDEVAADVALKERLSSSKDRMVIDRALKFPDPLTGEWIEPFDSVVANGKALYGFSGKEIFYVLYAYLGLEPCGIYLPSRDLVISVTHQTRGAMMGEQIANIRALIIKRIARAPDAFEKAVSAPAARSGREVVLVVGRTENFAHHLWNFYAAIERLVVAGAHRNVDVVMTGGTQFFGPISELFPEFGHAQHEHNAKNHSDPRPFSTDSLVVPTGSYYVPTTLSRRVVETMRRRHKVSETPEPADYGARRGPVVWFGMRLGDKSWADQETAIPKVIRRLAERFPDALFLLDGFSFPVGVDQISGQWTKVINELTRVAEAVRAASPDPSKVLNLVGNTLRESVLWADASDIYLAPLGSTQHKVGWFTDAPGLVYAPPMYGGGMAERTVGNWAIEISAPPIWLIGKSVGPGQRRGFRDTRTRMHNVELDTDELSDRMIAILEARLETQGWRCSRAETTPS